MKKALLPLVVFAVVLAIGCSKSQDASVPDSSVAAPSAPSGYPSEVAEVVGTMTSIMDDTSKKLEDAASDKDAAAALEAYSSKMKNVIEKAKALQAKHPTLAIMSDEDGKLAEGAGEAAGKSSERFVRALMAVAMKYPTSPAVMKAYEKLGEMGGE